MDVEFRGVRSERAGGFVLDVPSLRLQSGRTTAILGPNGSGKTTLLRLIAGLDPARAGEIHIGDSPVGSRPRVGYMFQEHVFLRRSVRENLRLALYLQGVELHEADQRVLDAAQWLGVSHLLDRAPIGCRAVRAGGSAWHGRCA